MLKSCQYCGRIHDKGFDCGKKPQPQRRNDYRRSENTAGRYTNAWKLKAAEIKRRQKHICPLCYKEFLNGLCKLKTEPLEAHHIIPLEENAELLLEDGNIIGLCRRHHEAAEAGEVPRGELLELARARDIPREGWLSKF